MIADGRGPIDADVVRAMNHRQRRRGPDGEGLWTAPDGRLALGHRRLAIIDLSDAAAQPMADVSGRWIGVFNGEIYNYLELRRELESLGRRFQTRSDTEVLINAVAEWGEAALKRLRGMFAFALWDAQERALWLARDRFGVKPLYYAQANGALWFASQARALAQHAPVDTTRDAAGLVGFYLHGYVPEPFTWWSGVTPLPAGSVLKVSLGEALRAPRVYADVAAAFEVAAPDVLTDDALRDALLDSVAHHLVSDAPIGLFLSAGVDSTALAMLAGRCGGRLRTLTLAFDDAFGSVNDEAPFAEETARALGAEHHTARLSRDAVFGLIDDFFDAMDQPTTDGLNVFLISRAAAAAGLKATLSGLGGDEMFGGYPSFTQIPLFLRLGAALPFRDALGAVCERIGGPICSALGLNPKLASLIRYSGDCESAYFIRRCLNTTRELELLLDESWRREGLERLAAFPPHAPAATPYAAIAALELTRYMRNQPLRDADWAGMAHGVEIRVPFLDTPVLARLAPVIAGSRPPRKVDLARACGPRAISAAQRGKTGFVTPIADWLRAGGRGAGLRPWAERVGAAFRITPPAVSV